MNRLIKICVFSALVAAGSLFATKNADAGYGYGYQSYGYRSYNYYTPSYYTPSYLPSYNYGYNYGGFCY